MSVPRVTVVLVRTHSHGNLGAAARAARNFGAGLVLVAPFAAREHEDARAFASGAEALLDAAPSRRSLNNVIEELDDLVALTAMRGRATPGLPPRTTWPALRRLASSRRIGLVFGPERGGLTTEELRLCGARISLPSRPDFPTLNLAQSVAATLAILASGRAGTTGAEKRDSPAAAAEMALVLDRLRETLAAAGWPGKGHSREVLAEVASMLRRARPTSREATLLLGALAALQRR